MIRIVTAGRLRRLAEESEQARARARDVQAEAEAAWAGHVREVWELTSRAESAGSDAAILREEILRLEAVLNEARTELALMGEELEASRLAGPLVLLLHYGEPHSIHRSHADAFAYTATCGVSVNTWGPRSDRPVADVNWVSIPFTLDEAVKGFRSVAARSPEGWEGAA